MKERIFWDTWAFVALADSRERGHHEARAIRRQLFDEDHKLVTTEAVLTELGNHFLIVIYVTTRLVNLRWCSIW